ncbi:MAG: anaerobic glycerol-3-phosphate dehydrogenase subunit C [Selenomonadaceae bacterium]|nr:anaerobic glycerol-3-phosphate dehydrogenase subunit C [Selenomonadaceae bacterium]
MSDNVKAIFSGDRCLSCTACMAACPVMAAIKDYRGPKLVAPAHGRLHFSQEDIEESLNYCSNCKSCDRACPSGVAISTMIMLQRAEYYKRNSHIRAEDMLAHTERMANTVRSMPFGVTLANIGMTLGQSLGVFSAMGITDKRNLPAYAEMSFKDKFPTIAQESSEKKVVLFTGCYINDNEPQIGEAFIKVMQANGYEVLIDREFKCCGSPLVANGFLDEARQHADNNVARILEWKEQGIPVVTPCTSCSLMLKEEYYELFDDEDMRRAGENVFDAFEFLEVLQQMDEFNYDLNDLNQKLLYHVPCHLKSQAIGLPAADILELIGGVTVKTANAGCCGMSGNYGFQKDKYDIAMKIGAKLFERVNKKDFDQVISDCHTCRIQIEHGTKIKPVHPIEILAQAYQFD